MDKLAFCLSLALLWVKENQAHTDFFFGLHSKNIQVTNQKFTHSLIVDCGATTFPGQVLMMMLGFSCLV